MKRSRACYVVLITCPTGRVATRLARLMVRQHVAACVNILSHVRSHFWWQGKVTYASEQPLVVKTTAAKITPLRQLLKQHHPYTVPELVALPIRAGLPAYLDWVRASCR